MKLFKSFIVLLIITLFACSQGDKKDNTQVRQLSYSETIALIFPDSSDVGEWHGRPMNMEAKDALSFSDGPDNHGCGVQIMLTNSSERKVLATITSLFPFADDPWELSRDYILAPGETKHVANTTICHDGKETPFKWKVRGASYSD